MSTAIATLPPLAWDRHDQQFLPPEDAKAWKVRRVTAGRPVLVKREGKPLYVELYATMDEFEEAIDWQPGVYRLYPVDENQDEIMHGRVSHIVFSMNEGNTPSHDYMSRIDRVFDVVDRLLTNHEHKDILLADITKTLVTSQTDIQRGVGELLSVANTTIAVASGVEAVERQPPPTMDMEELTAKIGELLTQQSQPAKPETPWFVQLLNGPIGQVAMQFVQNFMRGMAQAQAAQAAQAQAQAASKG